MGKQYLEIEDVDNTSFEVSGYGLEASVWFNCPTCGNTNVKGIPVLEGKFDCYVCGQKFDYKVTVILKGK